MERTKIQQSLALIKILDNESNAIGSIRLIAYKHK